MIAKANLISFILILLVFNVVSAVEIKSVNFENCYVNDVCEGSFVICENKPIYIKIPNAISFYDEKIGYRSRPYVKVENCTTIHLSFLANNIKNNIIICDVSDNVVGVVVVEAKSNFFNLNNIKTNILNKLTLPLEVGGDKFEFSKERGLVVPSTIKIKIPFVVGVAVFILIFGVVYLVTSSLLETFRFNKILNIFISLTITIILIYSW